MTTKNMEARREAFEKWALTTLAIESMEEVHPIAWQAYNAALDSICVEMPFLDFYYGGNCESVMAYDPEKIEQALEAAGVPYK